MSTTETAPADITVGDNYSGTSSSSKSGWQLEEFAYRLRTGGYVVVERSSYLRPWNHRMIGTGVGHDDARWAETRFTEGSMAAYYENGQTSDGRRWWDTDGFATEGIRYYGCRPRTGRYNKTAHAFARHTFLMERGASHATCPLDGCTRKYADHAASVQS